MNEAVKVAETEDQGDPDSPRNLLRQSREMVPVGPAGVQLTNLAQQVDFAQTMAKAIAALPEHLRGKVGDCLAIVDISSRAGLSPYMVASKTYVQNNRLCFESQLFHAFAQASGLLKGDLDVTYEGVSGDRVCIITGLLRSDPSRPRVHRSPPLRDLHPGYSLKRTVEEGGTAKKTLTYAEGQKLKEEGKIGTDQTLFSKGSPLWDRKPDVQMFYDTSRDWVRMFAPRATLGIYTPDEVDEYGPEFARDVTPATSGLHERLRAGGVSRDEGHKEGQAAAEIEKAKNGGAQNATPEMLLKDVPGFHKAALKTFAANKIETFSELLQLSEVDLLKLPGIGKTALANINDVIAKNGFKLRDEPAKPAAEGSPSAPKTAETSSVVLPRTPAEWGVYCRAWIDATPSAEAVRKRWNDERQLRNTCGVVEEDRKPVQDLMTARCKELGE